jgi:hypothetical protein
MKRDSRVVAALLVLTLFGPFAAPATADDQRYLVSGRDSFVIGGGDIESEVDYRGTQRLTIVRHGKVARYVAKVAYERNDQGAETSASADFVVDLLPGGEQLASADHDPDYLTILNQPFSAQLDRKTLHDLRTLSGSAPFDFPSPFTGSVMHGTLKALGSGILGAHQVAGVRFAADGPMNGRLADRPGLNLIGTISMTGTAFYDVDTALLVSLDATVTISASVSNRQSNDPVTIVYRRSIRSDDQAQASAANRPRR